VIYASSEGKAREGHAEERREREREREGERGGGGGSSNLLFNEVSLSAAAVCGFRMDN